MSYSEKCIICLKGKKPGCNLCKNTTLINELLERLEERVSLGDLKVKPVLERLQSFSKNDLQDVEKTAQYHNECRKSVMNKVIIERLRKNPIVGDDSQPSRRAGRPSTAGESSLRPRRVKSVPLEKRCLFKSCNFCPDLGEPELIHVETLSMGSRLVTLKNRTVDDQVRTCVADLHDDADAFALGKWYHKRCLIYAQRTVPKEDSSPSDVMIKKMCDEQIISYVLNVLCVENPSVSLRVVNDHYIQILNRYHVETSPKGDFKKHIKSLIAQNVSGVTIVSPKQKNRSDNIVLDDEVSKAVDARQSLCNEGNLPSLAINLARELRKESLHSEKWCFNGNSTGFTH